jgi:hypothetical protein
VNFIRSSLVKVLAAFTCLGNVGFNVFTHTCKKDGISRSLFIHQNHQCEHHQEESLPPCCKKKAIKDDNCCNDEVDVVKINLDFFNQYQVSIHGDFIPTEAINVAFVKVNSSHSIHQLSHYTDPPPKPWGKEILILHQVFRI